MNKNIVIFGCDNTGKTTLANDLIDLLDGRGILVPSAGMGNLEYQEKYLDANLNMNGVKIWDRYTPIEETVCGRILRGKGNFDENGLLPFYMNKIDLFIFCYPGMESVLKWGNREQMEGVKENVVGLINGYNLIAYYAKQNGMSIMEYNYNIPEHWEKIKKEVLLIAEEN